MQRGPALSLSPTTAAIATQLRGRIIWQEDGVSSRKPRVNDGHVLVTRVHECSRLLPSIPTIAHLDPFDEAQRLIEGG